jgi:ABC-2 type transport system ATP-binding protein
VLLSSHLLLEVEALADRLVIIDRGRIVAQGTRADLLSGTGTLVRADDMGALRRAMFTARLAAGEAPDGGIIVDALPEEVGRAAFAGGVALTRLGPAGGSGLEQLFFNLTAGDEHSAGPDLEEAA